MKPADLRDRHDTHRSARRRVDKPKWAPDGRALYFISQRPTSYFDLWAVRFDPDRGTPVGQPFALSQFDTPSRVISQDIARAEMDVSSRHAVLTIKTVSGSIWMLTTWTAENRLGVWHSSQARRSYAKNHLADRHRRNGRGVARSALRARRHGANRERERDGRPG
jgi:hypothetical protein